MTPAVKPHATIPECTDWVRSMVAPARPMVSMPRESAARNTAAIPLVPHPRRWPRILYHSIMSVLMCCAIVLGMAVVGLYVAGGPEQFWELVR